MANETDNIEFTRLFNDYILSDKVPSIEYDTGSITYGKDNPNNINEAINKITIDNYSTNNSLQLVKAAAANITYGWNIANNGLFRQYIYEYEIVRHPDINFKTIALQITGTENMARLIYDKKLLHSILGNTNFNETYDVSKNGWLMALANPNKWFKEFIEHNKGSNSFEYETPVSGIISQSGRTNILKPVYIFNDGDGGNYSYTQLKTVNEIISNWSKNFYQTTNNSEINLYIKEHNDNSSEYKLVSQKDGSIGFIYDISITTPSVNYYKPTYNIIGVGPLINKTDNKLNGKDLNDYWCNNKLVLYMYMYDDQIIELETIISNVSDITLVKLYNESNETGMVSSLNAQTQLTNKINNHHEIVDTVTDENPLTWSKNSYTSTGAEFENLNIYNGTTFGEQSYKTGDAIINTYAPESSRYINNLSVVYNKPCGSNPGNHIFGPETVYRIDYDSIKNKTIDTSRIDPTDYQITFGETTTSDPQLLPALPVKSFKHKFGKSSSQILAGNNGDKVIFKDVAKAEDNKVYIISRLSLLPINNMEFYEGHNKLYVNVSWYNKMYNLLKEYYKDKNTDIYNNLLYITPTFANTKYIPLEILPVYDWLDNNYYWELNYSGNTILTFNEGGSIDLTQKESNWYKKDIYKVITGGYEKVTNLNDIISSIDNTTAEYYPSDVVNGTNYKLDATKITNNGLVQYLIKDTAGKVYVNYIASIDIDLGTITDVDKRSEYEYYFRNFITDGHIKIDNYSQEILLLNSIFTDVMLYNYNCPLKCNLTDKELSLIYETNEVTYTYKKVPYCIYPQGTVANNMDVTGLLSQNISALLYRNSFHKYSNGTYAPTTANGKNASYASLPGESNYTSSAAIVKNQFNKYGQSFRTVNNDQLLTNPTPQEKPLATSIDYGTINTKDKYITYFKLRA